MIKKKMCVIINPISGGRSKDAVVRTLQKKLDNDKYEVQYLFTDGPRHASLITKEAIKNKMDIVVAVGGDGTVNEIGQSLIGSDVALGIIPKGSGNGLARHLNIPQRLSQSIDILNKGNLSTIDAVSVNDKYYLGIAGIGFDAEIGWKFAQLKYRGFFSYLLAVVQTLPRYHPCVFDLIIDGRALSREAFLISFANSSQFGNGVIIAPKAKIHDGLIDVVILNKFPPAATAKVAYQLFHPKIRNSKYLEIIQCREVEILQPNLHAHIDGEPVFFEKGLRLKIIPGSVKVLVA